MKTFNLKKALCLALVLCLISTAFCFVACNPTDETPDYSNIPSPGIFTGNAKNVIMLIGDGMGPVHIEATKAYFGLDSLYMESMTTINGEVTTRSRNNAVTDSGASATALSCGVKADNYNVARIDGINVENMAEYASLFNMDVGIIATESIVGATPSGFASHANDRNDTDDLYNGHMSSSVDIYMSQYDEDLYTPARTSAIANNGFTHISTLAEMTTNKYSSSKIFATFPKFDQYGEDNPNCPTLAEASTYAINYLDQKSDNGFFMMIEASHIDKYSHDNDFFGMVKEVRAFDDAVKAVLDWAKADGETLVIITADHETGGLVYNPGDTFGNGLFRKGNHTGVNVRFFAIGFNEEGYGNGVLVDNTLLNHIMRDYIANQRKAKA
jgi:alkaline phosphatase